MNTSLSLFFSLLRLGQLQNDVMDRLAIQEAVEAALQKNDPHEQLSTILQHLHGGVVNWLQKPDPAMMPVLVYSPEGKWGVLSAQNAHKQWVTEWWDEEVSQWREEALQSLSGYRLAKFSLSKHFIASKSPVYRLIRSEIFSRKGLLFEAFLGGMMINTVAIATSLYSFQIYNRVIPTGSLPTLLTLTIGVIMAICYEMIAKKVRSKLYDRLVDEVDRRLARSIYMRFLAIRLDQLPQSVGTLAAQMQGYETVRNFLTSITTHLLVDAPFVLFFVAIIAIISGWLAVIPLTFFIIAVTIGCYYRSQVDALGKEAQRSFNFKTGLLVETVEGAEIIKSGQGGWRMLSRWMKVTDDVRDYTLRMHNIREHFQYSLAAFQQLSYVLIMAGGALLAINGELTMGGLLASAILSGKILSPIAAVPEGIVQWAHAKAALEGLDYLWSLQDDHHGIEHPIEPQTIRGDYLVENVTAYYEGQRALAISSLTISAGEKVGVVGPIGAGKTTLLRLLSGMYRPLSGRILLDGVDISHISRPVLAEHIGYVSQEGRLFSGTLRENLILGLIDPGDDAILEAARMTGLLQAVLTRHPKGLYQEIFEGGTGLSAGQRQLVHVTRVLLRKPNIWLLDEPTSLMDRNFERMVLRSLSQAIKCDHTLILVTHKFDLLRLVERVIVVANNRIIMDGPKEQVLKKLQMSPQASG
jgi:ATP-binding cassette subfamily C protein LapB